MLKFFKSYDLIQAKQTRLKLSLTSEVEAS